MAEAGAGECGELALAVRRRPAKRSEPAPASKSARSGDVGIGGILAKAGDGLGCDLGRNPLAREPRANRFKRITAPMQRGRSAGGVGGVIQKPRFSVSSDDRIDLSSSLLGSLRGMSPGTTDQNPPQILGRAGIAPEIAERPAFKKLGSDLGIIHLCCPTPGSRWAMVSPQHHEVEG